MELNEFIEKYDKPNTVVLLEGKRKVAEDDVEKLFLLGKMIAETTKYMTFRSGNAGGADEHFSNGVASVDKSRLEVIIPYHGHRKKFNKAEVTYSLDDINLNEEKHLCDLALSNQKNKRIIKRYITGAKDKNTIKAAYLLRDTAKVTGSKNILPAAVAIFYDDMKSPGQGGTGHTMNVCNDMGIKVFNQKVWLKWF